MKRYEIPPEQNLSEIRDRASISFLDFYIHHKTSASSSLDLGIEFKIDCKNEHLIKKDLAKLDDVAKKGILPLFINLFTKPADIWNLAHLKKAFYYTKAYIILASLGFHSFYYKK